MEKLVREGRVAVMYSPGFGAGWYSWNHIQYGNELVFDPVLANYILEDKKEEARSYVAMRFPDAFSGRMFWHIHKLSGDHPDSSLWLYKIHHFPECI